ncbi:MAG: hypothetical protein ACR2PO_03620 [Methyloligellaceae bacterium]
MSETFFKDLSEGKFDVGAARTTYKSLLKFAGTLGEDQKEEFNTLIGSICHYSITSFLVDGDYPVTGDLSLKDLPALITPEAHDELIRRLMTLRESTKQKRVETGKAAADLVTLTVVFLHPKHGDAIDAAATRLAAEICDAQMQMFRAQL